ncbi:MAG: TIGR00282 family metallophosphoesterase [Alphaproteobacteria bacterium]|nr:TIGR00282 family metallophosphoesterase [Alphaproteobacteria bacterium]
MRILFCGDVVGRSGREAVLTHLPALRERLEPEFIIINGENAAGGFGITGAICRALYEAGADAITGGNHSWDNREILTHIDGDPRLLRPVNYPAGTPGRGEGVFTTRRGQKILVFNVMTRLFMDPLDCPFAAVETVLSKYRLGQGVDAILLDIHGEATSEKMSLGHVVDGRVSAAVGTHTHVPTADAHILKGGTGYMTDVGMCGDYDSVIGMVKETAIQRFTRKLPTERLAPALGDGTLCAVLIDTDDRTGLATAIAPIRMGGQLQPTLPD